jgi:hypothetical protein
MQQSQSLSQFDKEIANLAINSSPRAAVNQSKNHATHALFTAAEWLIKSFGEREQAIELLEFAVKLTPKEQRLYEKLAKLYSDKDKFETSLRYSEAGLKLPNPTATLHYYHGFALKRLGKIKEAVESFRKAVALEPDNADAHVRLANCLLMLGHFEEGLREYEWRWIAHETGRKLKARYTQPHWTGKEDLNGKRIVVYNDQGFGDSINYVRYIKRLKERGAYVIAEVIHELCRLYEQCPYIDVIVDRVNTRDSPLVPMPGEGRRTPTPTPVIVLPDHDYVVPICTLPHLVDPALENIPTETYLWPKKEVGEELAKGIKAIKEHEGKVKVGIVWAGNQWHQNDRNRSCYLRQFQPIHDVEGVKLFSFQMGQMKRSWGGQGELALWDGYDGEVEVVDLMEGSSDISYVDLVPYVTDFNDSALLLQYLDLLITVDTSTAHLAGAIGTPVWILLPKWYEWRWQRDWYPSMRKYHQPKQGDWWSVFERVSEDLKALVAGR